MRNSLSEGLCKKSLLEYLFCAFGHGGSKHKVIQLLVVSVENILFGTFPPLFALMNIDNLFANLHYGVHIVGVDNSGDIILDCNVVNKVVDHD